MKVCPWCAEELADDARRCAQCGRDADERPEARTRASEPREASLAGAPAAAPILSRRPSPDGVASPVELAARTNGLAIASVVATVLSYPIGFGGALLAFLVNLVAIGLGLTAIRRIDRSGRTERGRELAWVGVALAGLGIAGFVFALARGRSLLG